MADWKLINAEAAAIMPVRPGTVSEADRASLRDAGIVVFEHENPAEVLLIAPALHFNPGPVAAAALAALAISPCKESGRQANTIDVARSEFIARLAEIAAEASRG